MADISRSILQSINRVIAQVEKHDLKLNQKQCTCLTICLGQVRDCLFSRPIRIYRKLLERIQCTVKKIENVVVKCGNKNWLVNALSVGISEEETKDLILELQWCVDTQFSHLQGPLAAQGEESRIQWIPPQMSLPSAEDIRRDRESLVIKIDKFLSTTGAGDEQCYLAKYVQGRLEILEGNGTRKPSLEQLLWKLKPPVPSKYEPLGRGATGIVFKTSWLGIPSAMKSLQCCNDEFSKEAGTLAVLNHPNIVKLYCCYEDTKHQSLVMELMEGSLLDLYHERRKSRKGSPFELEEAVEILLQIVKGMLYLHRHGFAHRGLKCANILVANTIGPRTHFSTGDLTVKVADFELVKLFDPANSKPITSTHFVGTTVWRAPEVLNDDPKIKPRRADIYSFGMLCYEVLVGKRPFEDTIFNITKELHCKIIGGLRPPLPEYCPVQLKTLIENCWNANFDLRPSFEEIYDCLLDIRSSLMLGTNIIATRAGESFGEPATTRAIMSPVFNFGKFVLSLFTNSKEASPQTSNILEQNVEPFSSEDHTKALHELDELDKAPNDIAALSLRADIRFKLQDFKGSLADLDKMDVLQPNHGGTLKRRGQIKHMLEDYRGALKDLDDAMEFFPDDSNLLIQRSQTKKMLKDFEGALEDLNAADDLVPHDALILGLRGELKKIQEDFKGALEDLNEVSSLCPHNVCILDEISQVKRMMQDREEAGRGKKVKRDEYSGMEKVHICRQFPCPYCGTFGQGNRRGY